LAKGQTLSQSNCKLILGVAGGTFLAGFLLSCFCFPSAMGGQESLVYLKSTMPEISFPAPSIEPSVERIETSVEPLVRPTTDQDLITILKTDNLPAEFETLQVKERWQTVRMRGTGYCSCAKCCGKSDGITACNHRIARGDTFVAADKFYGFGTEMVIPGYSGERPVKVLDRGRAIKGNRLDLYFPTHEQAQKWGVKYLDVKVKVD
jgi:3D (Asp-Asp-Asp) domain-containing protein